VRLYSRPGNDLIDRFPLIVQSMARLPACTIDGEAVACDDNGRDSPYVSGRSPYWLKVKNPASEAVRREAEEDWS
jgi:ATP-dependent DNA ligase